MFDYEILLIYTGIVGFVFLMPFLTNGKLFKKCFYITWSCAVLLSLLSHYYIWEQARYATVILDVVVLYDVAGLGVIASTFLLFLLITTLALNKDINKEEDVDKVLSKFIKYKNCIRMTGFWVVVSLVGFSTRIVRAGYNLYTNLSLVLCICVLSHLLVEAIVQNRCKKRVAELKTKETTEESIETIDMD